MLIATHLGFSLYGAVWYMVSVVDLRSEVQWVAICIAYDVIMQNARYRTGKPRRIHTRQDKAHSKFELSKLCHWSI